MERVKRVGTGRGRWKIFHKAGSNGAMQNPVERWFADAFRLALGFTSAGSKGKGLLCGSFVHLPCSSMLPRSSLFSPGFSRSLRSRHISSKRPTNVLPTASQRHPTSSKRPPNVIRRPPASSKRPPNGLQTAPERFPTFSRVLLTFSRVLRFPPSHFLHPIHPVSLSLHPLSCIHTENPATTVSKPLFHPFSAFSKPLFHHSTAFHPIASLTVLTSRCPPPVKTLYISPSWPSRPNVTKRWWKT